MAIFINMHLHLQMFWPGFSLYVCLFFLLLRLDPPWPGQKPQPQRCRSAPSLFAHLWTCGSLMTRMSDRTHPGPMKKITILDAICHIRYLWRLCQWLRADRPWTVLAAEPAEWKHQGSSCTSWSGLCRTPWTDSHGNPHHQLAAWLAGMSFQWLLGTEVGENTDSK